MAVARSHCVRHQIAGVRECNAAVRARRAGGAHGLRVWTARVGAARAGGRQHVLVTHGWAPSPEVRFAQAPESFDTQRHSAKVGRNAGALSAQCECIGDGRNRAEPAARSRCHGRATAGSHDECVTPRANIAKSAHLFLISTGPTDEPTPDQKKRGLRSLDLYCLVFATASQPGAFVFVSAYVAFASLVTVVAAATTLFHTRLGVAAALISRGCGPLARRPLPNLPPASPTLGTSPTTKPSTKTLRSKRRQHTRPAPERAMRRCPASTCCAPPYRHEVRRRP